MDNTHFPENHNEFQQEISSRLAFIPFHIEYVSSVSVEIYDLSGNKCALIPAQNFMAGEQQLPIHIANLGISAGKYVYYLQIVNEKGTTRECRMMNID